EALRLSQETIAAKDAHFAALTEHWIKLLAEKDAELAQTREEWGEALRLSQEVSAQKDAALIQTREQWGEALRLSEEALAQRDAELAKLRERIAVPGISRAELEALRIRFPWVGVFGPPKSASTFVWAALARLLNADRMIFNFVHPEVPGVQLM